MQETGVQSLGWEDPLEKEMAAHSSISCLDNPMDGGAWSATVHGVANSGTRLNDLTFTFHFQDPHKGWVKTAMTLRHPEAR